jgi:demethylmenaquinone methyltransferase/2-methoxy-6-polyprenyl-1,4-benzoquinol methylase
VIRPPAFARDRSTWDYYEQRAPEYDEWYTSDGLFASRERPGWSDEVDRVVEVVQSLPAKRTLDVACGTGFLGRHLSGDVIATDRSIGMVRVARPRLSGRRVVVGDALALPFVNGGFERVLTGHFYGHLPPPERASFLAEARRLAPELVVIDSAVRPGIAPEGWQDRVLNDGSHHRVYKRYFLGPDVAEEIGGVCLFAGRYFVIAAGGGWV